MIELTKFCAERTMSQAMEDAFLVYCKSTYATEYLLRKEGDTIKLRIEKMTRAEVEDAWRKFLNELMKMLPSES